VFWPVSTCEIPLRSEASKVGHTGWLGSGRAWPSALAAAGAQANRSAIAGSRSAEPRVGALPRSIERRSQALLVAIWMNSNAQSLCLQAVGTPNVQPLSQLRLSSLLRRPGTVVAA